MNEEKKLSDFDYHSENPFGKQLMKEIKLQKQRAVMGTKRVDITDYDSGEIQEGEIMYMGKEQMVDRTTFMKLYMGSLDAFFDFTKTAQKVLKYFFQALKRNQDSVSFNLNDCMMVSGLKSKTSIYTGIAELLSKEVIAKGPNETTYFINPSVMFNGDRLVIINKYMIEDSKNFLKSRMNVGKNDDTAPSAIP